MMTMQTPLPWRRAWQLHRARDEEDSRGDPIRTWDMEEPDYVGEAGQPSGVCWQISSDDNMVQEYGEQPVSRASFVLYDDALEIAPFDRCVFGGGVWEVRAVTPWLSFRQVELERVSEWTSN